jgi:hypothetical protein
MRKILVALTVVAVLVAGWSGIAWFASGAPLASTQESSEAAWSRRAGSAGLELQSSTQSGRGPWLFPPIGKYLDQQARG